MTRVLILGGGPSGVGAALRLRQAMKAEVVLLERAPRLGGNAASFDWNGHRLDFGSHRLHPATDPEIMTTLRDLLGDDLLDRPRHGRIRLLGRWLQFPLKPLDLALHAPPSFLCGAARDAVWKSRSQADEDSFAGVLATSLGPTICERFYFPYARKLWGRAPQELAAVQARRRVAASSFAKLARKILGAVPGFKKPGFGRFWYPKGGFGAITEALGDAARSRGARILVDHEVVRVERLGATWRVEAKSSASSTSTFEAEHVWSTIPLTAVIRMLGETAPEHVRRAARSLQFRAMVLLYLELDRERYTPFDAHYFPEEDVLTTRLSEPKNYAVRVEPHGRTALCAELPCDFGDSVWSATDDELAARVAADLERSGLPAIGRPLAVRTERLPQAYPIYLAGYEESLRGADTFLDELTNFVSFGRQGLFAHDNTHHTLAMAWAAERCLGADGFDKERWWRHREDFAKHVVED